MKHIEKLIWANGSLIMDYSKEQWIAIAKYLLNSLESFFAFPIFYEDKVAENVGKGFSLDIKSKKILLGPLQIQCKGILGGDIVGDPMCLHISLILFLFSRDNKLITNNEHSFLYFNFERNQDGNGIWVCSGWQNDIYGEYEFFDNFYVKEDPCFEKLTVG